jgi:hypothetical protein
LAASICAARIFSSAPPSKILIGRDDAQPVAIQMHSHLAAPPQFLLQSQRQSRLACAGWLGNQ